MEWFSKKTSIAGIQLPNWMIVLGAIIVILIVACRGTAPPIAASPLIFLRNRICYENGA